MNPQAEARRSTAGPGGGPAFRRTWQKTASGGLAGFRPSKPAAKPRPAWVSWAKKAEGVTHSVMDTLDYGISSPQLALMNNGQVFVAGQVEPPMTPPAGASQALADKEMSDKLELMDVGILPTITVGSRVMGDIGPFYTVDVAIWESTFPYYSPFGGSIGHVFVGRPDMTVLLSQFPVPSGMTGVNSIKGWADTVAYEGCPPDHIYEIKIPNQAGFLAGVATNVACPTWNWYPTLSSETNCTVSAYNSLIQGGLPLGAITLPESPLGFLTCLNNLIAIQSAARTSKISYNWHISQIK